MVYFETYCPYVVMIWFSTVSKCTSYNSVLKYSQFKGSSLFLIFKFKHPQYRTAKIGKEMSHANARIYNQICFYKETFKFILITSPNRSFLDVMSFSET